MKKRIVWGAVALMLMAVAIGCSGDDEPQPVDNPPEDNEPTAYDDDTVRWKAPVRIALSSAEKAMVTQSNAFAFNLFNVMVWGGAYGPCFQKPQNLILSPLSITYALGMLNNGAAGDTQAQINNVLGFGDTGADGINTFCKRLMDSIPLVDPRVRLKIANNIYVNKGYELKDDFVTKAKNFYSAQPETRDFADGNTRNVINKWVSNHTNGMIPELIKSSEFNPAAVSYLLNAIYFRASWTDEFNKKKTHDDVFKTVSGNKIPCKMMHSERNTFYTETSNMQVVRLGYGSDIFTMTIFLPKHPDATPRMPTIDEWNNLRFTTDAIVDLDLPRFKTDTDITLNGVLEILGMTDAFSAKADFRNFCDQPTYISLIKQAARISVDEEGTEASAATAIGLATANIGEKTEPERKTFRADHSFSYVISERQTGAILFLGQYVGE